MDLADLDREILGNVWLSSSLWDSLIYLCDECNGRLTGSVDERRAGAYLAGRFQAAGLQNVSAESFDMPAWERGDIHLQILDENNPRELYCMALVGSPAGDVQAEIVDIGLGTVEDFDRLASRITGNILLTGPNGPHRLEKYVQAQQAGAAAIILAQGGPGMSISAASLGLRSGESEIPIINLAQEHVEYLRRQLQAKKTIQARLSVKGGRRLGTSKNIVAEIPGSQPEQGWIIACAHYDGHDLGQAAQDNATGTAVMLEAARVLAPLQKYLKVGIKFALFAGEEEGIYGSPAFVAAHEAEWDSIRLAFNADIVGCAAPLVLKTQNSPDLAGFLRQLPLADIGASLDDSEFINNSDHFSFSAVGISSLMAVTSSPGQGRYWVHSPADTLDKLDVSTLRDAAATTARILLRMSLDPEKLPKGRKSAEEVKTIIIEKGWEKLLRMQNRCPF